MKPEVTNQYSVRAPCPNCDGALSVFNHISSGRELGYHLIDGQVVFSEQTFSRTHYKLLECSGCGRGALAKFFDNGRGPGTLAEFYPRAIISQPLPDATPEGIVKEYREAELCMSVEAWRAASALLRSVLEKTLKANGYNNGSLQRKIDNAADDGVITSARRQKAHDEVRVLGNEVVHDDWKEILEEDVDSAIHYAQRIIEDFYDDRDEVEKVLREKKRLTDNENTG